MTDTIKAVAEAMKPYLPAEIEGNIFSAAEAAINAMQIREMTAAEVSNVILESWEAQKENLSPLTRWLAEDASKSLAKLGCIRIVGEV